MPARDKGDCKHRGPLAKRSGEALVNRGKGQGSTSNWNAEHILKMNENAKDGAPNGPGPSGAGGAAGGTGSQSTKGSTDQHALVQQLREGSNDFFASFVAVLDKTDDHRSVQGHRTAGDYLIALLLGTRRALTQAGRCSYTLVVPRVDERRLGAIVALHERAVGAYASMLGINAYDQPGVEAGKRCAEEFLIQQDQARAGTPLPESEEYDLLRAWMRKD